ncbi:MAG TPA: restriction endonuclease subunit S [Candidatus Cloacimonadota bacterium]|nr:restriction endonuclease subunit S [Candidatus Cloacimonadota bacterium]
MIKKGVMQELLTGKRRLKGFTDEWFTTTLGKIAEIYQPKTISQQQLTNGLYPVYGANGLIGHYDTYNHETWQSYITCRGSTCGEITKTTNYCWITGNAMVVNVDNSSAVDKDFFYYNLLSQNFSSCITGSGQPQIVRQPIYDFKIILPNNIAEQQAIARILSDLDEEIEKLELKRDKCEYIKQGMMQKLLTGQIRLVKIHNKVIEFKGNHNKAINEAVLISVLSHYFGSEEYPLGRKRYTKLSYLFHRHTDGKIEDYLKKAAGPYNPHTKYKGSEKIALQKDYVVKHKRDKYVGFIIGNNYPEAESYFLKWYGQDSLNWLLQFRKNKNDYLELIATVDNSILDLSEKNITISPDTVYEYIGSIKEWKDKLKRKTFSKVNIKKAIQTCYELFNY